MPLDHDSLAAVIAGWLPKARWFAGKARRSAGVTIIDAVAPPDAPFVLAIVDVAFAVGGPQRYVVPADPDTGADQAATPACAAWLVEAALGRRTVLTPHGRFAGERCGPPPPAATGPVAVAPLGADASNTSLRVQAGHRDLAVKILRRVRAGIQPEVEVGAFLAEVGWQGTPRLLGWLEYAPRGAPSAVLATVHEFAADCTGAWNLLVALVVVGGLAGPARGRILALVEALGRTTAELHAALASRPDAPAFAPVVPTPAERAAAAERMAAHATGVLERAGAAAASLPTLAARLAAVAGAAPVIAVRLRETAHLTAGTAWIRAHGDYHLGQVLVAPGDRPLVIDFEGEPGRSLEDRRTKASAARDVAGMCRSLDYLLRHAARTGGPAYDPALRTLLERRFLDAYAAAARGAAWWPADAGDAAALLAAHVLDKAVYELAYELDNRPDWVEVPLAALEGLAGTP